MSTFTEDHLRRAYELIYGPPPPDLRRRVYCPCFAFAMINEWQRRHGSILRNPPSIYAENVV